jgi:hypothetical protein
MNNNMSIKNITSSAALDQNSSSSSTNSFCITCGFDFGTIIDGVDNKVAGLLLVILSFTLICSPCIIMACCYMFRKSSRHAKKKKSRGKKYRSSATEDDDDDDGDVSDE